MLARPPGKTGHPGIARVAVGAVRPEPKQGGSHVAHVLGSSLRHSSRSRRDGPTPESIDGLIALLASDVSERTSGAASGLAKLGPAAGIAVPASIATYARVLESESHFLGQGAVRAMALGRLGPHSTAAAESVAILNRGLDSKDTWIRIAAADSLGNFGPDAATVLPKLRELERSPIHDLDECGHESTLGN